MILQHVTIGSNFGSSEPGAPVLMDNVFVGVGAKIIGKVTVGSRVKVGANALIIDDVAPDSTCYAPKATVKAQYPNK